MPPRAKYNAYTSLTTTVKSFDWKEIWSRFGFPNKTMGNNFILENNEISILQEQISQEDKSTLERKKILVMDFLEDRRENIVEYIDYILQLKREAHKKSSRIKQKDIIRKEIENELALKANEELERIQKIHREEMEKMRIEFEEKMAKLNTTTNTITTNNNTTTTNTANICTVEVKKESVPKKNIIVESKICEKKKLLTERIKRKKQEYNAKNNELQQLGKEIEKLELELSSL